MRRSQVKVTSSVALPEWEKAKSERGLAFKALDKDASGWSKSVATPAPFRIHAGQAGYRPEIDGLRAIAVCLVVLYHAEIRIAGIDAFRGGFVGVDVFFVISGYLIGSILLREIAAGRFSFLTFYERRARRILPALYVVLATSVPFAWLFLLPDAFKDWSASLLASVLSLSNLYFWKSGSYDAAENLLRPLIHTWSLGVEEQYYVVFPVLLLLLWTYARRTRAISHARGLRRIAASSRMADLPLGNHLLLSAAFATVGVGSRRHHGKTGDRSRSRHVRSLGADHADRGPLPPGTRVPGDAAATASSRPDDPSARPGIGGGDLVLRLRRPGHACPVVPPRRLRRNGLLLFLSLAPAGPGLRSTDVDRRRRIRHRSPVDRRCLPAGSRNILPRRGTHSGTGS